MSDTESYYSRSPRAFDGETAAESTTEGLDSADFEETEREVPEVSIDSGSTSSVEVVGVNGARPSTSPHRIPMAKPKDLVFGVDHLEPNILTEAELAKIRALYNIPDSVKMRIPGPLESLSSPKGEAVFFTDAFKHGLRLLLRHSGSLAMSNSPICTVELSGGRAEGALRGRGADVSKDMASASGVGIRGLGIGTRGNRGEAHPHTFPNMSLKRPIATKREIEVIERVRSQISEEDRFHKALLDYKNLYRAGLISEPEYLRRKEEEEEKERQSK
ncbi:unnamed protein product, partial [Prunus brigantina]